MTTADILSGLSADSISVTLTSDAGLSLKGNRQTVELWLPLIRESKASLVETLQEAFTERSAILEFDAGLSRPESERVAAQSLGIKVEAQA